MKLFVGALFLALVSQNIFAKEVRSPEVIFAKKCAMCHKAVKPATKKERKTMVAPPINVAMAGVVITIDAVEGPLSDKELREESIAFLKDYLYDPTPEKTNCEDHVVKKYGRMPSLKGFISPEELDVVVPWTYDTFKPVKTNGKYPARH